MNTYSKLSSPIGVIYPEVDEEGRVVGIGFTNHLPGTPAEDAVTTRHLVEQLEEYFAGERTVFTLELAPKGTIFQKRVWDAVIAVEFGKTSSYGRIADGLGMTSASRAIGNANGKNPIPIIIPCHRIIGSKGHLTGYAGGLDKKKILLELEEAVSEHQPALKLS